MELKVMNKVLSANDAWANENRQFISSRGIKMFNIIGSPGAGKTTLLEKTIDMLKHEIRIGVIEGDIATSRDAMRIQKKAVPVFQINTGTACHLDANLVNTALKELCRDNEFDCIFVENIGNLVCPAEFDIGEDAKIAMLSVTEGDDKVEKYPLLFCEAGVVVISKTGLLEFTDFNMESAVEDIRKFNAHTSIFKLDSISSSGFSSWINFLRERVKGAKKEVYYDKIH